MCRSLQDLDSSTYRLLRSMPMMNLHGFYLYLATHGDFNNQTIDRITEFFCSREQYQKKQETAVVGKVDPLEGLM